MKRDSPLVSYDSTDEESEEQKPPAPLPKRRKLPALNSNLISPARIDNPSLHQGRIRTTPHVEGQFAAYVYVPLKLDRQSPLYGLLCGVISSAKEFVPILHRIPSVEGKDTDEELRISLTRPIYLRAHQQADLKDAVRAIARAHSPFSSSFATFAELQNDELTRTFLTLEVGAGHDELKRLCDALTPTLRSLRQKEYYSKPRFHASIAWALLKTLDQGDNGDKSAESSFPTIRHFPPSLIPALKKEYDEKLASKHLGKFEVDSICVRIGKQVSRWPLAG